MIIEKTATGKTTEEALANAKAQLNAPDKFLLDVHTELIDSGSKGILGFIGKRPAVAKAWYDDGRVEKKPEKKAKSEKKAKPVKQDKPQQPKANRQEKKAEPKAKQEAKVPVKTEKKDFPKSVDLEYAKAYLLEIIKGLDINDASVEASYSEGVVTLDLSCEDYGIVIGRRGDTLDSIQYLISLAMKKHTGAYVRVSVNVGDYREKRNETLRHLARKNSAYVLKTGRRYTFEPMNPYERRVIHTAVQEIDGVESRSIGYDQERRVVIEPVGGAVKPQRRDVKGSRGRGDRPRATTSAPADYVPKNDRPDLPKFGKIEVNKD